MTCTIITTEPSEVVRPIHGRMPAILLSEHEGIRLVPGHLAAGILREFLAPYPAEAMEGYPIPAAELIRPAKRWW